MNKPRRKRIPKSAAVNPIFFYLKKCKMDDQDLIKLRDAGYIPIAVESFGDVKIAEPTMMGAASVMASAAYAAIHSETGYPKEVQKEFGRLMAKALSLSPSQ